MIFAAGGCFVRLQVQLDKVAIMPIPVLILQGASCVPTPLRRRICDSCFTAQPIGSGAGIGLAVSSGIVEAHGGSSTLAESDGGACFETRLRRAGVQPSFFTP